MVSFAGCRIAQELDVCHCPSVYIGGWQTVVGMAEGKAKEEYFLTNQKLYRTQVSGSINESLLEHSHACSCMSLPVSGCGPGWLAKPEILTVWPFMANVCWPLT